MRFGVFAVWMAFCLPTAAFSQGTSATNFDDLSARASAALQQKEPKQAAEFYKQALALKPSWAEGWFYLGTSLYELHRYPESYKAFERASALAPNKGAVWAFMGLSEYQMADYPAALANFKKAEKIGLPDDLHFISSVHNCAAFIYLRARDFEDAIGELEPLAKIADSSPITIAALGVAGLGMPYLPSDVPPSKHELVELAGRALWALYAQRADEANALFPQLVAKYPNEPGVHYLDGIHLVDHDPDGARVQFERELKINPSNAVARLQIAMLDIMAGSSAPAIPLAEEAIRLEPRNALAHEVLGRAYLDTGDVPKAVPELELAARYAPDNPQAHFYLERGYRRAGRLSDAQKQRAEFDRLRASEQPVVYSDQMTTTRKGAVSGVFR